MSFEYLLNKIINVINRINNSEKKYYMLFLATFGAVQLIYKYSWYVKLFSFIILIMNFVYLYLNEEEKKIKYRSENCLTEENKESSNLYYKKFTVWFSFFLLLILYFVTLFDAFLLEKYGDLFKELFSQDESKRSDIFYIIMILFLICFSVSFLLSFWCTRQSNVYYFGKENILYKKKYFRLKVWNTIMHIVNNDNEINENKDRIIYNSDITIENLVLIDFDEHQMFKEKLKFVPTCCLEWILFYDQLPKFEDQVKKGILNPEGISRVFLAIMTVIIPISIEKNYTEVLSMLNNFSIPKLIFYSLGLIAITLIFWNTYKSLTFMDKRDQIDSFFYNDIKEELDSRNQS